MITVMDTEPQELLQIGQFAQVVQVSQKALRIYDQQGLLRPAYTDPDTGYRYYAPDQLPVARLIRLMRQMEMPLALIREALSADAEDACDLVRRHLVCVEAQMASIRRTAETLLKTLDKETRMELEVLVKDVPTQQVAGISKRVTLEDVQPFITNSLQALHAFVAAQGEPLPGLPSASTMNPSRRRMAG